MDFYLEDTILLDEFNIYNGSDFIETFYGNYRQAIERIKELEKITV